MSAPFHKAQILAGDVTVDSQISRDWLEPPSSGLAEAKGGCLLEEGPSVESLYQFGYKFRDIGAWGFVFFLHGSNLDAVESVGNPLMGQNKRSRWFEKEKTYIPHIQGKE